MVKRWLIPPDDRPGSHLEFFLKIQHVYGQKDDSSRWQTRISPDVLSKDDWPPSMTNHDLHLEFF